MKRLLAGILALTLLTCAYLPAAHAEETPLPAESATPEPAPAESLGEAPVPIADAEDANIPLVRLTVETVSADASGEAKVELTIEHGNGVDSLQCNLNYDGNAMKITRVEPGVTFPAEYCVANLNEPGRVRLAAACALGLDNESGTVVILHCKLTGGTGSAVTLSDVIVTTVGADYVQSKAYVEIADGGVTAGGGALPASAVTPWIPETPVPAATPTPEPVAAPAPMVLDTPAPTEAPEAEPTPQKPAMLPYVIVGVLAVLLAAGIVILLTGSSSKRKRRKKGGKRKSKKPSAKARR